MYHFLKRYHGDSDTDQCISVIQYIDFSGNQFSELIKNRKPCMVIYSMSIFSVSLFLRIHFITIYIDDDIKLHK